MKTEQDLDELFSFFERYADFLKRMAGDEQEKLNALLSNSLPRIEHAITMAQANAKELESLENKRIGLQERAGFPGMTFSEILEWVPEEEEDSWRSLFWRIQDMVDEIKFRNGKAMGVARSNLMEHNPEAALSNDWNPQASAYVKVKDNIRKGQVSLLETKI